MANEINVQASMSVTNGSFALPLVGAQRLQFDQAVEGGGVPGMVVVGSSELALDLSQLDSPGWLYMRNVDDTQSVQWGPEDGGAMVHMGTMHPGEPALFRLGEDVTLRMVVDPETEESGGTSAENQAKVQIFVLES